ncbi:MAG: sugar transferase [Planctomycetota bacterium]
MLAGTIVGWPALARSTWRRLIARLGHGRARPVVLLADSPDDPVATELRGRLAGDGETSRFSSLSDLRALDLPAGAELWYVTAEDRPEPLLERLLALHSLERPIFVVSPIFERLAIGRRLPNGRRGYRLPSRARVKRSRLKRALDLALAPVLLLAALPLLAVIALAVRLTSRGPALFRQNRLGKEQRPFTFLKFRTMREGTEDTRHREFLRRFIAGAVTPAPGERGLEPVFKLTDDSRITRIGAFMRRTSLDELPQLFNVLKGDMSLVGPRPALPYEAAEYRDWHRIRFSTEAGITGMWQVYGRSRVTFDDAIFLDALYTLCRSWRLDLKLLALTIPAALSGRGGL